jgi:hypothetical protein
MTDVEDGGAKYSEKISDYDMKDEIARKIYCNSLKSYFKIGCSHSRLPVSAAELTIQIL